MNYRRTFHFSISRNSSSISKIRCICSVIVLVFLSSCTSNKQLQLKEEVEVLRDKHGINHIYAKNQEDLFFMQGYLAAKDRLFQFEIWRRQATGTVAEIFGESELKRDILIFAKRNPNLFMQLATDENTLLRNFGANAVEKGILNLSQDQRTFTYGKGGRKVMTVPFDEHPYSALSSFFKTDEGMEIYKAIEKRLK